MSKPTTRYFINNKVYKYPTSISVSSTMERDMIVISSQHPFRFTFQYKYRLRDNVKAGAPSLIIKDLSRLYLYHLRRLIRKFPDMISLLNIMNNYKILDFNPDEFIHPECVVCTRHWRYTRGCSKNKFRCKDVKQAYSHWITNETNRIRESLRDAPNVIEVVCKKYSYFMVPVKRVLEVGGM